MGSRWSAIFLVWVIALAALGTARATVGGPGAAPVVHTQVPDLFRATVTQAAPTPTVRYCFDQAAPPLDPAALGLVDPGLIGTVQRGEPAALSVAADPDDRTCLAATFPAGRNLDQMSLAVARPAPGLQETVPLTPLAGTTDGLKAADGVTTAPDLVDAAVTGANQITYTFDEALDPTPATAYAASAFGYYADGGVFTTGTGAVQVDDVHAVVDFAAPVAGVNRFVALAGAVQDVATTDGASAPSTLGTLGLPPAGTVGLANALLEPPDHVRLTFSGSVVAGAPSGVIAWLDDGQAIAATDVFAVDDQVLEATFTVPLDTATRVTVTPAGGTGAGYGERPLGACTCGPGFTSGPDLMYVSSQTSHSGAFTFDEPIDGTPAAGAFAMIFDSGAVVTGTGTPQVSDDRKTVTVAFDAALVNLSGGETAAGAVRDTTAAHDNSPPGSAGFGCVDRRCIDSPTSTVTPGPSVTPTATPTVTATVTATATPPGPLSARLKAIHVTRRRVTGRLAAAAPCRVGRKVVVRRGSRRLGSAHTRAGGYFTVRLRRHRPGRVRIRVTAVKGCLEVTIRRR